MCIYISFSLRQSLQNKTVASNHYTYTCLLRTTEARAMESFDQIFLSIFLWSDRCIPHRTLSRATRSTSWRGARETSPRRLRRPIGTFKLLRGLKNRFPLNDTLRFFHAGVEHPGQSTLLDQAKLRPFNLPIILGRYMRVTNHYVASDILDFDAV
jgi:hypothetical protein